MSAVIQFRKKKDQLKQAMHEAIRSKQSKPLKGRGLLFTMAICLISTTLSFQIATIFFSISFITMLMFSLSSNSLQWSPIRTTAISVLISMSILSGCGPLLSDPPAELISFCSEKIGSCSTGTATSWVVCGFALNDISIETAQAAGELKEVFGVNHAEGFGLVAVKRITVFGG